MKRVRPRRSEPRAQTLGKISRADLRAGALLHPPTGDERPRTRGDCVDGERPCPFVGCRYNLFLDVTDAGSIKLNFPDLEPWELGHSCSLDVADAGGLVLELVGVRMNLTRERVRQLEVRGLHKVKAAIAEAEIVDAEVAA